MKDKLECVLIMIAIVFIMAPTMIGIFTLGQLLYLIKPEYLLFMLFLLLPIIGVAILAYINEEGD